MTGSFAAGRIAPVAAPALLVAYATDIGATADGLNLLPADEGTNVILLRPFDEVVWSRLDRDDGISYVASAGGRGLSHRHGPDARRGGGAACVDGGQRGELAGAVSARFRRTDLGV